MSLAALADRVDVQAREIRPSRAVLTIVTAVLFAVGWVVGVIFRGIALVVAWAWTAGVVGFQSGRGPRREVD